MTKDSSKRNSNFRPLNIGIFRMLNNIVQWEEEDLKQIDYILGAKTEPDEVGNGDMLATSSVTLPSKMAAQTHR